MDDFVSQLSSLDAADWDTARLHEIVEIKDEERPRWTAKMKVVRLALTGGEPGPSIAETMAVLGKERVLQRMETIKASELW
jgi:glutamyl/glutaminyl-tRNA synthetase